jgi:cell division protein ZapA
MSDLITINVILANRTYRLKIKSSDEEVVRKTVNLINDKILEFKTRLAGKDMQDYLAMVVLWVTTEQVFATANVIHHQEVSSQLSYLEDLIQKAIET